LIFDLESALSRDKLDRVTGILNEKLGGLSLKVIRKTFLDRIGDLKEEAREVIKIFIDSIDRIFLMKKKG